jgi:hypothetical protein
MSPETRLFLGLDLGQAQDYTALAVLERTAPHGGRPREHAVRYLKRWPLGTAYPDIVADVASLVRRVDGARARPRVELLEGVDFALPVGTLAVDATGVGRPVVDLLRRARLECRVQAVTITAGHAATAGPDGVNVPKKELVSVLQVLLQTRRLKVADALPDAGTLVHELTTFQTKVTLAGNETFGAWREGAHDDLVLAVALAAWFAEHEPSPYPGALAWVPDEEDEDPEEPRSRLQQILDDLGLDPDGDW